MLVPCNFLIGFMRFTQPLRMVGVGIRNALRFVGMDTDPVAKKSGYAEKTESGR